VAPTKTIVLIHGNFVNDRAWAAWKQRYEARGYTVHTPANAGHDGDPAALRAEVHPDLADTGFIDIVRDLEALIDTLPEKPLVIGHSMAGAAVMKLVEHDKVAAGVSVHGAPPANVVPAPLQTLKTALPSLGLFSFGKTWMGSEAWFANAFFNTLPEEARAEAFARYAVPESFKVGRQLLFSPFSRVDFRKPHVPLLFVGGTADHIFPASFVRRIAGRYRHADSRVDVKIYEGRSHFTCGEPGWEALADDILAWFEGLSGDAGSASTGAAAEPLVADDGEGQDGGLPSEGLIRRGATAEWQGAGEQSVGALSTDSGALAQVPYGFASRFTPEAGAPGTNPEELLAAAHAGCYAMSLGHALEVSGHRPQSLRVNATVSLAQVDGGYEIRQVHLALEAEVPGLSREALEEAAEAAKALCPLSMALHAVPIALTVA